MRLKHRFRKTWVSSVLPQRHLGQQHVARLICLFVVAGTARDVVINLVYWFVYVYVCVYVLIVHVIIEYVVCLCSCVIFVVWTA